MNTNMVGKENNKPQPQKQEISKLMKVMQSVKTNTPEAKLNTTSMTDNNGKRIEFNEDKPTISSTIMGSINDKKW